MGRQILALLLSALSVAAQQTPLSMKVVDLGYATYQSDLTLDQGVTSFLGMRYAAPPTGDLRWKAPQPPGEMLGVQNAMSQPHQCFQASITGSPGLSATNPFRAQPSVTKRRSARGAWGLTRRSSVGPVDEDCLFLNVHVPTTPKSNALLPVIVYMHGGGYDAGNVSSYPVEDFVLSSNYGVVAVSIQYRLGLFGFLPGQKVKDGGNLNVGLLDQNFALEWVQDHIMAFGGDRSKVTIWGQSAGAGSMLQHVVAHGGNTQPPLFTAVLMNSPCILFEYNYHDPIPETLYSEVVSEVNCADAADTLACLRTADASALLDADTKIGSSNFLGTYTFVPVIDGTFIVESPTATLKRGQINGQALLVSTNTNEGTLFVPSAVLIANNFTLTEYITQFFPRLSQEQVQDAVNLYSNIGFTTVPDQGAAVVGDALFVCPAYMAVSAFGQQGWKAEFAIPPATHAEDLSYEFTHFGIPPTYTNQAFQQAFQHSFLSTAMFHNPNVHYDPVIVPPVWLDWSSGNKQMLFNKTDSDAPVVTPVATDPGLLQRCAFWSSLAAVNGQ